MENYKQNRELCIEWSDTIHNNLINCINTENSFLKNLFNNKFVIDKLIINRNFI